MNAVTLGIRNHPHLALVYASLFIGALATYFLGITLAIDMVKLGFSGVVAYLESWLGVGGLILFPIFFYAFRHFSRRAFSSLVLGSQLFGTALILFAGGGINPLMVGLQRSFFTTAYYQMLHINLAAHASNEHRGFQMSLAQSVEKVGGMAGAILGGVLLASDAPLNPIVVAFMLQFAATIGFLLTSPEFHRDQDAATRGTVYIEDFWRVVRQFPLQNLGTAAEAFLEVFMVFMMPVWLTLSGIGAILVGTIRAWQALLAAIFVPLSGYIVHRRRGEEFWLGATSGILGWLVIMTGLSQFTVTAAASAWALSAGLSQTGLETRRYSRRSATQIFIREIILTLVRLPAIPLVCWLAFSHRQLYAVAAIAACLLVGVAGRAIARSQHESSL